MFPKTIIYNGLCDPVGLQPGGLALGKFGNAGIFKTGRFARLLSPLTFQSAAVGRRTGAKASGPRAAVSTRSWSRTSSCRCNSDCPARTSSPAGSRRLVWTVHRLQSSGRAARDVNPSRIWCVVVKRLVGVYRCSLSRIPFLTAAAGQRVISSGLARVSKLDTRGALFSSRSAVRRARGRWFVFRRRLSCRSSIYVPKPPVARRRRR